MVVSQFRLRSVVAVLFLSFFLLLPSISVGIRHMPITKMPTRIENLFRFSEAPEYRNGVECPSTAVLNGGEKVSLCEESFVHVAMTLDTEYLRGSMAAVHSILRHASCPENVFFHFIASEFDEASPKLLSKLVESVFPSLNFRVYIFREDTVVHLISSSIRQALENPLNYARNYLGDILNPCIKRVIYLDSDVVVVDDISHLWNTKLADSHVIAAPEYCHANFTKYFTDTFWSDPILPRVFGSRNPCYFNTGVMVMDLTKWREQNCRGKLEHWMELQRKRRIYELGSLPPFLLVFGGLLKPVNHRWNQHGLGGDNVKGSCRALHPGPISLLHWSGKGKPWARLDEKSPCPVDYLWEPYDLYKPKPKPNQQALLSSSGGSNLLGFS